MNAATPPSSRRVLRFALQAALILGVGLWVFGPAVRGGWLWDDNQEVTENAVLRDPAGLAKIWAGSAGADYFPLKSTVQWFEWRWWGAAPAGYHAASIALHLLSALLAWALLARLGVRQAWWGGLLFAVHPLVVESVAWAAELKNTLSLPFLLLALLAWVAFDERRGRPSATGCYLAALAAFLFAMLAKSSVVMLPFVLLLYAWWRRGRIERRDVAASAPFFAVSVLLGLVTLWFQHHRAMQPALVLAGGPLARFACAGLSLAFYAAKALWPAGLCPIYPRWELDPPSALQLLPWVGLAAIVAVLWPRRATWGRPALFALGFFILNLLPVVGFVTITYMHITWVADHFAYVALLGPVGLAAAAAGAAQAALGRSLHVPGWLWTGGLLGLALLLAGESRAYVGVFANDDTLWTYTVEHNPGAWSAHYNLATYLAKHGVLDRARAEFGETLRLRPDFAEAHFNLGNTYALAGDFASARTEYEETLRINPAYADAHVGLGSLRRQANDLRGAVTEYQAALRLRPDYAQVWAMLADTLFIAGHGPEAVAGYEQALRFAPDDAHIRANLAIARQSLAR
jgi:Tfp pilus assembly protein PilF